MGRRLKMEVLAIKQRVASHFLQLKWMCLYRNKTSSSFDFYSVVFSDEIVYGLTTVSLGKRIS